MFLPLQSRLLVRFFISYLISIQRQRFIHCVWYLHLVKPKYDITLATKPNIVHLYLFNMFYYVRCGQKRLIQSVTCYIFFNCLKFIDKENIISYAYM